MAVKKGKWYGNDVSNEVSLFENGLLMRRCGVMYEVIVWLGTGYVYGLFDDNDLIEDLESNRGVEGRTFSFMAMSCRVVRLLGRGLPYYGDGLDKRCSCADTSYGYDFLLWCAGCRQL